MEGFNGTNQQVIDISELLPAVMRKRMDGFRLVQACCSSVNGVFEVSYSFAKDYEFDNLRLNIAQDVEVPSISKIYPYAFLYENEMKELFGVKIEMINKDYHDKLYRISEETPFKK